MQTNQITFTEQEMADGMGIDIEFLRTGCDPYTNGRIDPDQVTYVTARNASGIDGSTPIFDSSAYAYNMRKRHRYLTIKDRGLWTDPEACNAWLSSFYPANESVTSDAAEKSLKAFVSAWHMLDFGYALAIREHMKRVSDMRDIWIASQYLKGNTVMKSARYVILSGNGNSQIPYQWLRWGGDRVGLFDRRYATDNGEFIPKHIEFSSADGVNLRAGDYVIYRDGSSSSSFMIVITDEDEVVITDGKSLRYTERSEIKGYSRR